MHSLDLGGIISQCSNRHTNNSLSGYTSTNVCLYTTMQLMVKVKVKDGDEERVAGGRRTSRLWRVARIYAYAISVVTCSPRGKYMLILDHDLPRPTALAKGARSIQFSSHH